MVFLTATAAPIITAALTLCPSVCPGAPSTMGFCSATPAICELEGVASNSVWSATTGLPDPQVAMKAVGIPEMFRSISKPACSRISVIIPEVRYSCIPNSAK